MQLKVHIKVYTSINKSGGVKIVLGRVLEYVHGYILIGYSHK